MVPGPVPAPSATASPRTIALVGIDGSGKTTQAHLLAGALAARGVPARYRRNAGGRHWFGRLAAALGRADGEDLLGRRGMLAVESVLRWLAILRTLLRRTLTREVTVMDRYAVCQFASIRAHARTPRPERLNRAERRARLAYRVFPAPDVTFLLAVDPAVAYDRIERRGYDHEEMSYLRAADASYRALPEFPRFVVIDANGSPEQVQAAMLAHLPATGTVRPARSSAARIPALAGALVAHVRAVAVTFASLAAAATVVTYQIAEGF